MKTWKCALKDAAVTGSIASLTSLAALILCARCEHGHPWGAMNAPSHWVWGDEALCEDGVSLRYSATGLGVHHLSSCFWAVAHEKVADAEVRGANLLAGVRAAAFTTALAAWVDLRLVPKRLTPGFERRLSAPSLLAVYGLFGAGLVAGSWLVNRRGRVETAVDR